MPNNTQYLSKDVNHSKYLRKESSSSTIEIEYIAVVLLVIFACIVLLKSYRRAGSKKVELYVDIHSHLIPGIDDGAKTLEESIDLIRGLSSLGYRKLITTPHIMSHRYANTKEGILTQFKALQVALLSEDISIEMEVASEYYFDEHFIELIAKDELLSFGDKYILFEFSYVNAPLGVEKVINMLISKGYRPLLAHPERYQFLHDSYEKYRELKAMGIYFQINLNSLQGYYGSEARRVAQRLAKDGMVDFIGSDTHKDKQLKSLEKILHSDTLAKLYQKNQILNNTL